ncbi:MAG: RNA methyltransferase [Bdellovibrionaceae bacterium]|nr:RNA methyltransferase [Pseudobdellovibrionaceae bacterium]
MSLKLGRFLSDQWPEQLKIADSWYSPQQIVNTFVGLITEERLEKIQKIVPQRSSSFIPVLENIYDRGNISAVMRSAEAFGFYEMHIIEGSEKFKESARVTQGADKWLNIYRWSNTAEALSFLKERHVKIYATHLSKESIEIQDIPRGSGQQVALIFGNEKEGVTDQALEYCDGNILIPMKGFTQSFNISVAAALCFQEAAKQAKTIGSSIQEALTASYILKSLDLTDTQIYKILESQ